MHQKPRFHVLLNARDIMDLNYVNILSRLPAILVLWKNIFQKSLLVMYFSWLIRISRQIVARKRPKQCIGENVNHLRHPRKLCFTTKMKSKQQPNRTIHRQRISHSMLRNVMVVGVSITKSFVSRQTTSY